MRIGYHEIEKKNRIAQFIHFLSSFYRLKIRYFLKLNEIIVNYFLLRGLKNRNKKKRRNNLSPPYCVSKCFPCLNVSALIDNNNHLSVCLFPFDVFVNEFETRQRAQ